MSKETTDDIPDSERETRSSKIINFPHPSILLVVVVLLNWTKICFELAGEIVRKYCTFACSHDVEVTGACLTHPRQDHTLEFILPSFIAIKASQ